MTAPKKGGPMPPWGPVPSRVARMKGLTSYDHRVLDALAARRNAKTGRLDPSLQTISEDTEIHDRNVSRSLKRLEAKGVIRRQQRRNKRGELISTFYELIYEDDDPPIKSDGKPHPSNLMVSPSIISDGTAPSNMMGPLHQI